MHLRLRLQGHLRRPARRRLLHPRGALHRRRRRAARAGRRGRARRGRVAAAPGPGHERRQGPLAPQGLDREGGRGAQDQGGRRRVHLPQPPRLPGGRRVRAAPARRAHRPAAARGQARRLLAAADPPVLPHRRAPRRHLLPRGHHRRVRPPRLGPRRPRPRLVLLVEHRGARRRRAGLPQQPGRAHRAHGRGGLRRARAALRGAPRHRQARPLGRGPPADPPARAPRHGRGRHGRWAAHPGAAQAHRLPPPAPTSRPTRCRRPRTTRGSKASAKKPATGKPSTAKPAAKPA